MGKDKQNWLIVTYNPVSLFSLRSTYSTSSGGKTLFVPTPYAFKIAMVDAAYRVQGERLAKRLFEIIKHREIRFRPPEHLTVNHTFVKIKREPKVKTPGQPFISSIAFREFCFFKGPLEVAIDITNCTQEDVEQLALNTAHINYFGKRGCFFQFAGLRHHQGELDGFMLPVPLGNGAIDPDLYRVTQFLDDIGNIDAKDFFDRINSFSKKSMELGKHRVLKPYMLPYRQITGSKSYTYYRSVGVQNVKS